MKLLHLPNERSNDRKKMELISRTAFENLYPEGVLAEYHVYSFLYELKNKGIADVEREILQLVDSMKPDIVFWQHISEFNPAADFFLKIKQLAPKSLLVYQDEDPYGRWIKPISTEMQNILSQADYAFTSGTGRFAELFGQHSKKVGYFPHCFDLERLPKTWNPLTEREIPLVMIGSMFKSKVPFRYLPGALKRKKTGELLNDRFGHMFFLYGAGWDRYGFESARGPLPFDQQFAILRNSWISVNWDHFDSEPCYSSDRLPFSLASGTPHITNWHPGYDLMFKECQGGLYFAHTPKEAAAIAGYLLSRSKEFLIEEGKKAFDFAYDHYESTVVYRELMQYFKNELQCKNEQ